MAQQRYHVHVCLVKNEQPDFENALQIATADDYFLTWDLQGTPPQKTHYSRQQIDKCDYVLFILADGYGELNPSGVGYLHLNYVYAMTKRKPMFAVIKNPFTTQHNQRQRSDFAQLIQKEQGQHTTEYSDPPEAIKQIIVGLQRLAEAYPRQGWHKFGDDARKINDFLFTPKVATDTPPIVNELNKTDNYSSETPIAFASREPVVMPILPSDTLALNDTTLVSYTAHAYQDGNLSELTLTHSFSWQDILNLLNELPTTFSADAFSRKMNEHLGKIALIEATKIMPNAHAVSRCQINALDFNWIRKQLINHHFLIKATDDKGSRELWQLNPQIKAL